MTTSATGVDAQTSNSATQFWLAELDINSQPAVPGKAGEVTRYDGVSTLHRGPLVAKEHGSGSPKLDFLAQQLHVELKITALIMKKLCTLQMLSCARYCIHIYRLKMRKQPKFAGNDFGAWPEPIDSWDLYFETHLYSNVSPLPSVPCNFSTCNVAEAISCGQSWLQATPGFSKSNNHIQQVEHETWIQKNSFEEVTKPLKSKDSLPNLSSSVGVRCLFVLRTSPVGSQPECPPCT